MADQGEPDRGRERVAVLVPVKAFSAAKLRLAAVRSPADRADLARRMAAKVLLAAGDLPVAVVCDDEEVRAWAIEQGADAIWTPELGLNGAVEKGVAHLASRAVTRVIVAHADLPLATDLAWLGRFGGVTLVPDRHRDGTNVAAVPSRSGFRFSYGGGSFASHRAEAARLGLPVRLIPDDALGWDVDVPSDLTLPDGRSVADALGAPLRDELKDEAPCR